MSPRANSLAATVAVAVLGAALASAAAWTCDDAFISFRYADNLVQGQGLVFNAGERIEGYTNPAWTVWIAAGLLLGLDPEPWSIAWGIAAYVAALVLLARTAYVPTVPGLALPVAATLGAFHSEWNVYASSGLETSAFTTLALCGYLSTVRELARPTPRSWHAGAWLGAASITRPDGIVFAAVAGAAWLVLGRPRVRACLLYAVGFAVPWVPVTAARIAYYGAFLPNTYHAKSADLAWWDQGGRYLALYLDKYWVLALGLPLGLAAVLTARTWLADRDRRADLARRAAIAAGFAIAYALYVTRVGGDFMYGRLLVPTVPYCVILLEIGLAPVLERARRWHPVAALCLVVALEAPPKPVSDKVWLHGIADEWAFYSPEQARETERRGRVLARFFAGLPVRVVFLGAEARLVYFSRVAIAVEGETGLTDATIAHQPLPRRGRPGHEKHADLDYLLGERSVHFALGRRARAMFGLEQALPLGVADLDGVPVDVLRWDPELMAELGRRGAVFADFPRELDALIADLPALDPLAVADAYGKVRRFYFDHVDDPERERPFLARLGRDPGR